MHSSLPSTLSMVHRAEPRGGVGYKEGGGALCGEAGWVRSGPRGSLTVYLERSDSIERRKANKLSAPLKQEAEAREKEPTVRSTVTHPTVHTVLETKKKRENFLERGKRNFIMLGQYL